MHAQHSHEGIAHNHCKGNPRNLRADFHPLSLTAFSNACFYGQLRKVKNIIDKCPPDLLHTLLNLRESLLRMPPLLSCVSGSRWLGKPPAPGIVWDKGTPDHVGVVQCLLEHKAEVTCKDVAGSLYFWYLSILFCIATSPKRVHQSYAVLFEESTTYTHCVLTPKAKA